MRSSFATVVGVLFATTALQAEAAPAAKADFVASPEIALVAQGCGLGFHRGPLGGCRPNVGPRVVAPAVVVGRRCVVQRGPWGVRRVCR